MGKRERERKETEGKVTKFLAVMNETVKSFQEGMILESDIIRPRCGNSFWEL